MNALDGVDLVDLTENEPALIRQAAEQMVVGFGAHYAGYCPDVESGLTEVRETLQPDRICRGALDAEGQLLGWIGGNPQYDGVVWELHPLVVDPQRRRQGIGRALVADFETQVQARGGVTILLGADDEDNMTSLAGVDLYPDICAHIAAIRNLRGHPYEFYQKCGFVITGVVPDANGPGKPDILMAKRVATPG